MLKVSYRLIPFQVIKLQPDPSSFTRSFRIASQPAINVCFKTLCLFKFRYNSSVCLINSEVLKVSNSRIWASWCLPVHLNWILPTLRALRIAPTSNVLQNANPSLTVIKVYCIIWWCSSSSIFPRCVLFHGLDLSASSSSVSVDYWCPNYSWERPCPGWPRIGKNREPNPSHVCQGKQEMIPIKLIEFNIWYLSRIWRRPTCVSGSTCCASESGTFPSGILTTSTLISGWHPGSAWHWDSWLFQPPRSV